MHMKAFVLCLLSGVLAAAVWAQEAQPQSPARRGLLNNLDRVRRANQPGAQPVAPARAGATGGGSSESAEAEGTLSIQFDGAPVDMVFKVYQDLVGKTVLKDPQAPSATITLQPRKDQELTTQDKIEAIETVLEMNGIHIEPYGEKFVRALPRKDARKEGIPLIMDTSVKLGESTKVVSMMIPFKNIAIDEAQKALEGFKSNSGILLVFERTNSILATDTEQNINRMLEIARAIDIASPVMEVVEYIQIEHANATEIKQVIDAIVEESQKELEKNGKAPANNPSASSEPVRPLGGLLNRNRPQQPNAPVNQASLIMSVSDADRGMIRGKVVTIADERSNKILIITNRDNMKFFKEVIAALDVETTPDVQVKVYRLKYADAEDVSDMINDLIGNSVSSKNAGGKGNQNQNAAQGTSGSATSGKTSVAKKPANQRSGEAKAGELNKDNVTVLADKRINGLVVMARSEDIPTVEQIIEAMDVKLDQVLIETVIIEVGLGDEIKTGIDWVKGLSKNVDGSRYTQAVGGGGGSATPVAGASTNETASARLLDTAATLLPSIFTPGASGLTYALFSEKFNLGAVISASKGDSHSKYLASPVVMTVDNKEAQIEATKMRYLFKGYQYSGSTYNGSAVPDYEQKEIGITVKVTPKINPNGTVMLTVEEEYSQEGPGQEIEGQEGKKFSAATTITRKMQSDVSLENGQTVVFSGMTDLYTKEEDSGIPWLKDIPVIGKYLFGSTSYSESRTELLVFMTPYVLKDGDEAEAEAMRRKQSMSDVRPWQDHGWSKSKLAEPVSTKEKLRRQREEWKKLDEEHKTSLELERAKKERVRELKRRARKEAEDRMEELEREEKARREDAEAESKEIETQVKLFNKLEDERAARRASEDETARQQNELLKKLHEQNGIPEVK